MMKAIAFVPVLLSLAVSPYAIADGSMNTVLDSGLFVQPPAGVSRLEIRGRQLNTQGDMPDANR